MKLTRIKNKCPITGASAYKGPHEIHVLESTDNTPKWGNLKHVSISKPDSYPSWDEILEVKLKLFGDRKDAIMVIPKRENYVNVHENCFHLWESPESWDLQ